MKSSIGPLAILVAIMLLPSTESFAPTPSLSSSCISGTSSTNLRSLFDDGKEEVAGGVDLQSFNPLNYQAGNQRGNIQNPVFNKMSFRKIQMQEMTGELLNAGGDEAVTNEILNRFKDFLLEPLEDPDAVLDPDSIYTPQMSRKERYETYRSSMDQRIQNSKNGSVRLVLQSMRDFVLSFEDE